MGVSCATDEVAAGTSSTDARGSCCSWLSGSEGPPGGHRLRSLRRASGVGSFDTLLRRCPCVKATIRTQVAVRCDLGAMGDTCLTDTLDVASSNGFALHRFAGGDGLTSTREYALNLAILYVTPPLSVAAVMRRGCRVSDRHDGVGWLVYF